MHWEAASFFFIKDGIGHLQHNEPPLENVSARDTLSWGDGLPCIGGPPSVAILPVVQHIIQLIVPCDIGGPSLNQVILLDRLLLIISYCSMHPFCNLRIIW